MSTSTMAVKPSVARQMIVATMQCGLIPFLIGSPGIGKSEIYQSIADEGKLFLIDLRVSGSDPTDFNGFPDCNGKKATYLPFDTIPVVGDKIPDGYVGWLLLLDEYNSGSPAVHAATYKLLLNHMVGAHKVHPKVWICCAGNKETDNAIVNPLSTALQSRIVHIEMEPDLQDFLTWWSTKGLTHTIPAFLNFSNKNFHTFKPDHTDFTYACSRTWYFAGKFIDKLGLDNPLIRPLLNGTISQGVTSEYLQFCRIYKYLPTIAALEANPETIDVPVSPGTLFAIVGFIGSHVTMKNIDQVSKYISRLPMEFQVVCYRDIQRRSPDATRSAAFQKWALANHRELF